MALARSTRLGPYEILAKLGAGGMGEVYRARDVRLERDVAIKILPEASANEPLALARFQREAKAVAALSHPNILTIYDVGSEAGVTYAVTELLEGQSLAARLKQGPMPWAEALDVALPVAEGLAAAHARGIIHRDVKPDNVFLTSSRGVKVLDFGLARIDNKAFGLNATLSLETQPGVLLGTVSYMSPEQVRGHPADPRSDLFSFGCMFYEMLTGRRPFDGETGADVMAAVLHEPPPRLSESGRSHPAELDRIILRCLEKVPAQRFQSAQELIAALQAIPRDGSTVRDTPVGQDTTRAQPSQASGPSVAVLPFLNMSADPENEYFSDGLAEELLIALSKVEGLRVASRTSSFAYKGKSEDVRKIGQQLNVRTVLEGSVRKAGQRLRVSAQLVNVDDGYHLWSETFNRQLEDVFAIQDEIAQNIVKALRVILTEKDRRALEKPADAPDVQAYEFYLRGRQFFHQFRRKGYEFAQQTFARAIAIDPNYAKAYAGIADCHSLLYTYWETSEENLRKADEASLKALQLGPNLAEAHLARGLALSLKKEFDEAAREFETAIRLDPNLFEAYYFYGRACKSQGKLEQSTRLFEEACRVRPDAYQPAIHLNAHYLALGRREEAQASCRRSLRIVEKHLELHPDDARALYLGATVWCQIGEQTRALEWAGRGLAMDPEEPVTLYNVACVYSLQGEVEKALDCLEKSLKNGFAHKEWIIHDSDLDPLHGHPRYEALLAGMGAARPH